MYVHLTSFHAICKSASHCLVLLGIVSSSYSTELLHVDKNVSVVVYPLALYTKLPKLSWMPNVWSMLGVGGCSLIKRLNSFIGQFNLEHDVLLVICRASLFFCLHRCTIPHDNSFSVD
jgi:hypothetical protein